MGNLESKIGLMSSLASWARRGFMAAKLYFSPVELALLAAPVAACGDTINNYYTDDDSNDARHDDNGGDDDGDNGCGDSPVFGKYLWNLRNCETAIFFKEDCSIELCYDGEVTGCYNSSGPDNWGGGGTYHNLDITLYDNGASDGNYHLRLIPNSSFLEDCDNCHSNAEEENICEALDIISNSSDGYVLNSSDGFTGWDQAAMGCNARTLLIPRDEEINYDDCVDLVRSHL